ncbi:predicted glycosyl transferase [unidentified eubacterium SCB49]|nr:predicted glycosyl transferase [unidentified eubacterium SCB49]
MKVGLVLSRPPGYSETFLRSKISGLLANGIEVELFVFKQDEAFDLCKVHVAPQLSRFSIVLLFQVLLLFLRSILNFKRLRRFLYLEKQQGVAWIERWKKALVNINILKADLDWLHFGFVTLSVKREFLAEAIGANLSVSFRGFDIAIYALKNPACYTLLWEKVDKVHANSYDLLHRAYELGLHITTPYQIINPSIEIDFFKPKEGKKDTAVLKILTVARLHWKKGFDDTFNALALLKKQGVKFSYSIVGDGTPGFIERLRFSIFELGLTEEVHLLGKKSREEVSALYDSHALYIQYSVSEGFCNAVLEAQLKGLLCIVSDAEGLPENIIHEETGFVVPKCEPTLLAESIKHAINVAPDKICIMKKKAQKRVTEEFNLRQQQQKFVKFYN